MAKQKPQVVKINSGNQKEALYLVSMDGQDIGLLGRWQGQGQPWKAYLGVGAETRLLGARYPEEGGRAAALALIVQAAG